MDTHANGAVSDFDGCLSSVIEVVSVDGMTSTIAQHESIQFRNNLGVDEEMRFSTENRDVGINLWGNFEDLVKPRHAEEVDNVLLDTDYKTGIAKNSKARKRSDKLQVKIVRRQLATDLQNLKILHGQENIETVNPKKRGPGRPKKSENYGQTTKTPQSEVQRDHRDRKNRSVDILRRVVPGVSQRLDTAGVLEMSIRYVLYLHKEIDTQSMADEFCYNEMTRKLAM